MQLEIFNQVEAEFLTKNRLKVAQKDHNRPWGGFFVIDEDQADLFVFLFFPEINTESLRIAGKLSPKILLVKPGQRLSWQYHHRRAEIWRVIAGSAGVVRSKNDQEGALEVLAEGELVRLEQGERHRLVGLADWAVIAEIWQHTDPAHSSDEADIVRLQDDYGR